MFICIDIDPLVEICNQQGTKYVLYVACHCVRLVELLLLHYMQESHRYDLNLNTLLLYFIVVNVE